MKASDLLDRLDAEAKDSHGRKLAFFLLVGLAALLEEGGESTLEFDMTADDMMAAARNARGKP
jgi:hypothetical protein